MYRATHLKPPQTTDVIAALKADGLETLIQATFDAHQSRTPPSNNRDTATRHASALETTIPNWSLLYIKKMDPRKAVQQEVNHNEEHPATQHTTEF